MAPVWPDSGYIRFPWHPDTYAWALAARRVAAGVAADTAMRDRWLECQGTWFVGVDALPSEPDGSIGGVPLAGPAADCIGARSDLHPAQLSIIYPGYPRPRDGESDAGFRYRVRRDAAHMDGVLADGAPKRRYLRERHDWILGLPLTESTPGASPLVVWSGSHRLLQPAMQGALKHSPEHIWPEIDVTDIYVETRAKVFETCPRVPLFCRPGEALLLHPFLLHGVAPWQVSAHASRQGRMIAYFRPEPGDSAAGWLGRA